MGLTRETESHVRGGKSQQTARGVQMLTMLMQGLRADRARFIQLRGLSLSWGVCQPCTLKPTLSFHLQSQDLPCIICPPLGKSFRRNLDFLNWLIKLLASLIEWERE